MSTIIDIIIFIIILILIVAVSILIAKLNHIQNEKYNKYHLNYSTKWPFFKKSLMTRPEQILYFKLVEALPEYLVFSQVQLSRILGVEKGNDYYKWNNRINRMSADFVVCNRSTEVIALIELDDSSHEQEERKEADQRKNKACADAGVRVIRWNVKAMPDQAEIRKAVVG